MRTTSLSMKRFMCTVAIRSFPFMQHILPPSAKPPLFRTRAANPLSSSVNGPKHSSTITLDSQLLHSIPIYLSIYLYPIPLTKTSPHEPPPSITSQITPVPFPVQTPTSEPQPAGHSTTGTHSNPSSEPTNPELELKGGSARGMPLTPFLFFSSYIYNYYISTASAITHLATYVHISNIT